MLSDLFQKLRKSESTRVLVSRRIIIIMSSSLLIAILVILCIGVYDELPSIRTTFRTVDNLLAPGKNKIFKVKKKKIKTVFLNINLINQSMQISSFPGIKFLI